jgi:hypothetical protein
MSETDATTTDERLDVRRQVWEEWQHRRHNRAQYMPALGNQPAYWFWEVEHLDRVSTQPVTGQAPTLGAAIRVMRAAR